MPCAFRAQAQAIFIAKKKKRSKRERKFAYVDIPLTFEAIAANNNLPVEGIRYKRWGDAPHELSTRRC